MYALATFQPQSSFDDISTRLSNSLSGKLPIFAKCCSEPVFCRNSTIKI